MERKRRSRRSCVVVFAVVICAFLCVLLFSEGITIGEVFHYCSAANLRGTYVYEFVYIIIIDSAAMVGFWFSMWEDC